MQKQAKFVSDALKQAQKNKDANKTLLKKLKKQNPRAIDRKFHEAHQKAFDNIDCLECANCCKTTSPIFYQKDIERLSKYLKIKPLKFIDQYLMVDEDKDFVLKQSPCVFLGHDNYCTVYDARPTACREYPHTDRKKVHQLFDLTLKNASICPAVATILEYLNNQQSK